MLTNEIARRRGASDASPDPEQVRRVGEHEREDEDEPATVREEEDQGEQNQHEGGRQQLPPATRPRSQGSASHNAAKTPIASVNATGPNRSFTSSMK